MAHKKGAIEIYRLSRKNYLKGNKKLAQIYKNINRFIFECDISYEADLGDNLNLPHQGLGVVIGPNVKVGKNCRFY